MGKKCVTRKFDDLVLQNSVVVVQNDGLERQKACCTGKFAFLLIRSIDLDAISIKPGFHMSGKSQTIGDFAVSRLSQILPTNEN